MFDDFHFGASFKIDDLPYINMNPPQVKLKKNRFEYFILVYLNILFILII